MAFTRTVTVRFDEGDPAGILFHGRIQSLAHRVFEDFIVSRLVERWEDWFMAGDFIVPIRHAEADFIRPMRPGHSYEARLWVSKLGESSFEVSTEFRDLEPPNPVLCAATRVVHVFADPHRLEKIPIPSVLRGRLEAHLVRE